MLLTVFSCENRQPEPHVHKWSGAEILQEPSCTSLGAIEYHCECGETMIKTQERLEHTWNNGTVIRESTTKEKGEIRYRCTVCGQTRNEELPLHVHEYVWTGITDTYMRGHTEYLRCSCGHVTEERQAEPVPLEGTRWKADAIQTVGDRKVREYYEMEFLENGKAVLTRPLTGESDDLKLVGVFVIRDCDWTADRENCTITFTKEGELPAGGFTLNVMGEESGEIRVVSKVAGESGNPLSFVRHEHEHHWFTDVPRPLGENYHGYISTCHNDMELIRLSTDLGEARHSFMEPVRDSVGKVTGTVEGSNAPRCAYCGYYHRYQVHFEFTQEAREALEGGSVNIMGTEYKADADFSGKACCNAPAGNIAVGSDGWTHRDEFRMDVTGYLIPEFTYTLPDGRTGVIYWRDANRYSPLSGDQTIYRPGNVFRPENLLSKDMQIDPDAEILSLDVTLRDSAGEYVYWDRDCSTAAERAVKGFRFHLIPDFLAGD